MKRIILKPYFIVVFGAFLTAAGITLFFVPNKIVNGGVSGISTILYYTLNIPTGLSFAIINLFLFFLSFKVLGMKFVLKAFYGVLIVPVFVQLLSYFPPFVIEPYLASIFGGLIYGIGIGLTFIGGSITGGTDLIGRMVQHKLPHFPIGKLLLMVDGFIVLVSLITFKDVELALHGIFTLIISTYSIDYLIKQLNTSRIVFIITNYGAEVSKSLVSTSSRGVTILNAIGAYTMEEKTMLMCALKQNEIPEFQRKILVMDKNAFIIFSESQQIVGNGFYTYH